MFRLVASDVRSAGAGVDAVIASSGGSVYYNRLSVELSGTYLVRNTTAKASWALLHNVFNDLAHGFQLTHNIIVYSSAGTCDHSSLDEETATGMAFCVEGV